MFENLKDLYGLLTSDQRIKLIRLQFLVILMSFCEIAGVISIGPFMALVGDLGRLQEGGIMQAVYEMSGLETPESFLFWAGIGVLMILGVAGCISVYTTWRLSMYGSYVGAELANRLYCYYMHQPWLFHSGGNSSQLTKQISQEALRVTVNVINPLMRMNAKLVMAILMAVALFIYNPWLAISGTVIFVIAYVLLFSTVRKKLVEYGKKMSVAQSSRFKLMSEGFGGIKDVLLLNRQSNFVVEFEKSSHKFAKSLGTTEALSTAPRYAMEVLAFSAMIFLVLFLLKLYEGNLGNVLPFLSVYALAGLKMLPAFQLVYANLSKIRSNLAAFEAIRDDLVASQHKNAIGGQTAPLSTSQKMVPESSIEFRDVVFSYPGKTEPALNGVSMTIPVNRVVGLVGASGSGKSTVIDILLGLIDPGQGELMIDGLPLDGANKRSWQNALGYVPQSIFLTDSSILENIAFGLPLEKIDTDRVKQAVKMAYLEDLIDQLPEGLATRVGERGVQLSGGQRQRIGIARALYHDAGVLVLDEATSALDGITEKMIMNAIHDFSGKKTILMVAHRLATVKKCDQIYMMSHGKVVDQGVYEDLVSNNTTFRRMAEHS